MLSLAVPPVQREVDELSPTGQRAASMAARAMSGFTTDLHRGAVTCDSFLPSRVRISLTGSGSQYLPSAASVAYALARSSGTVSDTPSVKGPQLGVSAEFVANS